VKESNPLVVFRSFGGSAVTTTYDPCARVLAPRTGIEPVSSGRQPDCDTSRITRQAGPGAPSPRRREASPKGDSDRSEAESARILRGFQGREPLT